MTGIWLLIFSQGTWMSLASSQTGIQPIVELCSRVPHLLFLVFTTYTSTWSTYMPKRMFDRSDLSGNSKLQLQRFEGQYRRRYT